MKTTININGKDVEITLTKDQVEKIKQASLKITDRLKTWEDACEIKGIHPIDSLPYPNTDEDDDNFDFEEAINGTFQMFIIVDLLCEGWKPDYTNTSQYKYYPYFKYSDSGFGFTCSLYVFVNAIVGARLVFPTRELAEYSAKQFKDIYNKFLTK